MTTTFAALLMLLLVATSIEGRANRLQSECNAKCNDNEDSLFKLGKVYTYLHQGESNIETKNGTYDSTGLMVKSKVTIIPVSKCQMRLSMSDVEIFDKLSSDGNKFRPSPFSVEAKTILERDTVFFTRIDNDVSTICVTKNEPIWAQNMKKSIIDIIANAGDENIPYEEKETRHGSCMVERSLSVDKTRTVTYDVKSCKSSATQSLFTDLTEAVVFDMSRVHCRYAYEHPNNPQYVHCSEDYVTSPLKKNGNQITVRVTTRLERTDSKKVEITYPTKDLVKTDIQMQTDLTKNTITDLIEAKKTVKLLCTQQLANERSDIPRTFMTLVNQMKKLESTQMKDLYKTVVKGIEKCGNQNDALQRIFYDAVGFVNTPAATSVMVDLIKNKHISEIDQSVWFTSLSFMKATPTIEMIKDLETLLQSDVVNKQMYLGISAVTHLYCKKNYDSCLMDPTIRRILSFYLKNLNQDCTNGKSDELLSKIQISLKSLGNLKLFNEDVVAILGKCASTKSNSNAIRVSALEVMKHMDCTRDRSVAMGILENNENDSELRINAYLTVMGCSDINNMFKVRELLSKEKVNQVGSFIWTHLTNIRESDDLLKRDIQKLLNDVEFKKEFDISKLKFSRNIEKTFSTDKFGMTVDSNVIFSEKSFIPRSISVNTTAVILNRPTNFIEMSARMEGLDEMLFKLLGPDGYLNKKKDSTSGADDNMKLIKMLEEVNGNFNLKVFGQQISFVELIRGSLSSVRKYNIIEELVKLGDGQSIDVTKNLVLLDSVATLPTSLGFPLKLKVQGSVSVELKVKSKLDITGLMKWPMSLNIESHIAPSVMSEFSSEMMIETPFSNYGMRMRIKSGTNTEFKATITASNNEDFMIKFDTPMKKQEIVSVSGKTFVIHQDKEIEQLTNTIKKFELCSKETMTRFLGVKMCASSKITDAEARKSAILYGPFSASVYIEKEDSQTGYFVKGLFKTVPFISNDGQVYNSRFVTFEFNTPRSQLYWRRFYLEMTLDFKEKVVKFQLDTPWNKVLLKSAFKLTDESKHVSLIFEVDKRRITDIKLEHFTQLTQTRRAEKGMLTFKLLNLKPFETSWLFVGKKDQWLVKFDSKGLLKDDTYIKMDVKEVKSTRELALSNKYKLSGSYATYFGKGQISGVANSNYYGHRWDITVKHSSRTDPSKVYMVKYSHKTEDKSSKSLLKYFLTSTISYGENAENFVKFKIENELSKRHVRASIKTTYGLVASELKSAGEMDLQLYGGYTWKEDNILSQEGSLSFKFPSKEIQYEGRYNSEVGKKMLKMSFVLDENQTSKVNLKINYLQPKLYLKDTEFDVQFTLPDVQTDLSWALTEVDVNKYKYSLSGKYNKHVMKVSGIQTEISRRKYDSSIKISLPTVKNWPEKINIDLRVDFVNPINSRLNGKIEIPNSDHKYSLDLKLSTMPQNFLQMPISDRSSVFQYIVEVANKERTIKSETTFTCNPEEVQLYFNIAWNTLKNKDHQVTFDFHTFHKSPNYKQFDNAALIAIHYPGNSHSIGFKSKFKYSELDAQIDVMWNKNQKILIQATYEVDNNWTEMGLKAAVIVKTPFVGFEAIRLGINAVGQLRYRKIDIEFSWAGNKKILFDIVVQPRSSNDFTLTSKLVTPYKRLSLVSLQAVHICTKNSIKSEAILELGANKRYNIKFEGINNNEGKKRDFGSNLQIESVIFPPLKISFQHKDDGVHFTSKLDMSWMKSESLNVKNEFSYTFEENELITNGNLELFSTIDIIKQLKATWAMENRDNTFMNNVQFFYKSKNLFQNSIKGYFEKEDGSFKMDFSGFMRILDKEPMKVTNFLNCDNNGVIVNNFSLMKDTLSVYSHSVTVKRNEVTMKMLVVNTDFKTVEFKAVLEVEGNIETRNLWMKIGEKHLFKSSGKITRLGKVDGKNEIDWMGEFYSDYFRTLTYKTKGKIFEAPFYYRIMSEATSQTILLHKYDLELSILESTQKIKVFIESKWRHLKLLEFQFENQPKTASQFLNHVTLNYNNLLKIKSKIMANKPRLDVDILFHYKTFVRYFKFKYDRPLMGYDQLLETNLFGTTIKVATTIEARGGVALHTSLACNLRFLKSIDIVGRFSKRDQQIDIIYQFPLSANKVEVIKMTYSKKGHFFLASIDTKTLISTAISMDFNKFNNVYFNFRTLNTASESTVDVKFDYKGGINSLKHSNDIKIIIGAKKFVLENKFEKVKWSYILLESNLNTNIQRISNYKVGIEYNQRPSNFAIDLKLFCNERFVKLSTTLHRTSDWKSTIRLETSYPILKEAIFDIRHKQNHLMTQVSHNCEISLKSNDRKFQMKNKIDWSEWNYVAVESSIVARTSQNTYFIKPRSIKLVHQLLKNTLKEVIEIQVTDMIDFKSNLEIEMTKNPLISFELQLTKMFKMIGLWDFRLDNKKNVRFYLEKDMKRLINIEGKIDYDEKKYKMTLTIEETGSHTAEIEYELTNRLADKFKLLLKSSLLPGPVDAIVTSDYSIGEKTLAINAMWKKTFSLIGKSTIKSSIIEFKYGEHSGSVNLSLDQKEKRVKVNLQARVRFEMDFKLTPESIDGKFIVNGHVVKFQGVIDQFIELDVKIVDKIVYVRMKSISKAPYKYEITGRTNLRDWSAFNGEIYVVNGPKNYELTSRFSREDNDIYNIIVRKTVESFHFKYDTVFDLAKSGTFTVKYGDRFSLNLAAETIKERKVDVNLEITNGILKGKISTTFDWMKEATIKGELKKVDGKFEGSFLMEHNKLKEPLQGKISYKTGLTSLEVSIETPFSKPFDRLTVAMRTESGKTKVELRDSDNIIFIGTVTPRDATKKEVTMEMNIPKQLIDLRVSLSIAMNLENAPYTLTGKMKSNFVEETQVVMTIDPNERSYMVTVNNPNKQGSVTMKVSEKKTSLIAEYNGKKTSVELIHEFTSTYIFNGNMKIFSNMHPTSLVNVEMSYSHKIALSKMLSVNMYIKWNEKTAVSFTTAWTISDKINFDLKSKILLAPYETEYESVLELSNKKDGEFNLKFSPLGNSKQRDVTVKIIYKLDESSIKVVTPYGLLKSLDVKTQFTLKAMTQTITFDSTYLGQLEMINEYKPTTDFEGVITSQLKSPYQNGNLRMTMRFRYLPRDQLIDIKVDVNKDTYQAIIEKDSRRLEVKVISPILVLKKAVLSIKQDVKSCMISVTYNEYQSDIEVRYSKDDLTMTVKSTTIFANTVSLAMSRSINDNKQRIFKVAIVKDDKTMTMTVKSKDNDWQWAWRNTLCPFLTTTLDGHVGYSQTPFSFAMEISKDSTMVCKILVSVQELLLNAKTTLSEIKIHLTKKRLELIVMNSKLFSLLIQRSANDHIEVTVMINETQYSAVAKFVNDPDSFHFRIKAHRNSLEKLLDLFVDVKKQERSLDIELNALTKEIFKLKLSDKTSRNRKISTEIRVLFFVGIFDFEYLVQSNLVDGKLFWNIKLDDNQLCLGSITTTIKHSPFSLFSVNLNFASGAYQVQFEKNEKKKYDLKVTTPYKELNLELSMYTAYNALNGNLNGEVELKNEVLGEYKLNMNAVLKREFELTIDFDTTRRVLKSNLIFKNQSPNVFTMTSKVKLYNWDAIEMLIKLEAQNNVKLTFDLKTPFTILKHVSVEKTLWLTSVMEHKFKTTMEYKGIISMKYVGGHEISYLKRIIKFNGHLATDELKLVTVKFHGQRNNDSIDHVFIVDIKERRYGYRINGKFDPMFRGMSEIYTPFHDNGVLILQGHQRKNGLKIQAGKNKEEIAAFEYFSSEDVTFMKVTPPSSFGKPMAAKYRVRRGKRSAGEQYQTEINYGGERLLNLDGKVNVDSKKKMMMIKVSSPMLSKKTAELKLMHQINDGVTKFDHHLKIKDIVENIYRIVGEYFHKDLRNFKYALEMHHPYSGPVHFSVGHSIQGNMHSSNMLIKSNDRVIFMHNGKLMFEGKKVNGEFEIKLPARHYQFDYSHAGDLDKIQQRLTTLFNTEPFFSYKADIDTEQKSVVEIEIPLFGKRKLQLNFDKKERKVGGSLLIDSNEYLVELVDNNGQLKIMVQLNNEMLASLKLGYATKPLSLHASYQKHYFKVQVMFKESLIVVKADSSASSFKNGHFRLTKNKVIVEATSNDKSLMFSFEYHFIPNNFFAVVETSCKRLSKVGIFVTPSEIKFNLNEYFHIVRYDYNADSVTIDIKNNIFPVKTLNLKATFEKEKKIASSRLQVNEFVSNFKCNYSSNHINVTVDNNQFEPREVSFEMSRKTGPELRLLLGKLTVDKKDIIKMMAQVSKSMYATGIKTSFGTSVVASFNTDRNEVIISLSQNEKILNIVGRTQRMTSTESKTFVVDISIDTVMQSIDKSALQVSYTATKSDIVVSMMARYNNQKVVAKSQLTTTKLTTLWIVNERKYGGEVSLKSSNEVYSELFAPYNKITVVLKKIVDKYSMDLTYNDLEVLRAEVTQNMDVTRSFKHQSTIKFRGVDVWHFVMKSNFKVYEIKMTRPKTFEIIWKNEISKNGRIFSVWTKYYGVEKGLSVTFDESSLSGYLEISVENTKHVVTMSRRIDSDLRTELSATLLNKFSTNKWNIDIKTRSNEEIEIGLSTPKSKRAIKFIQVTEKEVKSLLYIDVFGQFKMVLKANKETKTLNGDLTIFGVKVAKIESSANQVKAMINENGAKDKRITLEWTKSTKGQWKKDYVSTKRLIVKQEALSIDIDVEQETRMEALLWSFSTKAKYQMLNGQAKTMDLLARVDYRVSGIVTLELKNPILPMKTTIRRLQPDKTSLRYEIDMTFNVDDKVTGFLEISVGTQLGITSRLYYNPENEKDFVEVHAKYLDDRQMEIRLFTEIDRQSTDYFRFLVRLLNEHNLEMNYDYRPVSVRKVMSQLESIVSLLTYNGKKYVQQGASLIHKELRARFKQGELISPTSKVLRNQIETLLVAIERETRSFVDEVADMMDGNEFYLSTMIRYIQWSILYTCNVYRDIYYRAILLVQSIDFQIFPFVICQINSRVSFMAWRWAREITTPLRSIIITGLDRYFPRLYTSVTNNFKSLFVFVKDIHSNVRATMQRMGQFNKMFILMEAENVVIGLKRFIVSTFGPIATGSLDFLYQEKDFKAMYGYSITKLENLSKELRIRLYKVLTNVDDNLYMITGERFCAKVQKIITDVTDYIVSQLNDESNQKMIKEFIVATIEDSFVKVNMRIHSMIKNIIIPRYVVLGQNSILVTLPIPLNDIKSIPDFTYVQKRIEEVKDIVKLVRKLLKERLLSGQRFIHLLRWFTPRLTINFSPSVLPDFESYATILGASVVTFDKRTLQLKSETCRVILAKDMRSKKWEIELEQTKNGRLYSLTIGRDRLTISVQDSKVTLNGKLEELPLTIGTTKIIAFGSILKVKDELLGLTIVADPVNDMFTVGVSGWYHGKVRGLFGTADNEPFNDLLDDNSNHLSTDNFFKTYSNGGQACQIVDDVNTDIEDNKNCPFLRKIACKFLYQCPFSPMATCFGKVNPNRYYQSCVSSSEELSLQMDNSVCQSARDYQSQCAIVGVKVPVPPPCRKCDVKGEKTIFVNEQRNLKIKVKVADIVFVVDEGKCLKNIITQLMSIVTKMEENLKEKGITSNRYGLVAFRGDGINEAHTHTINQKLFGSRDELLTTIKSLQSTNQNVADVIGAIKLASGYPFREYASKHIVLINCDQCEESATRFKTVSEILENNAIQFSVLMAYNFQVKDNDSKKRIFGVDSKKIYTTVAWRGEITVGINRPTYDYCYDLAMRRNGVVFNVNYLMHKGEATQKRFIDTFTTQVSLTAAPARTTVCKCYDDGEYNCVPVDTYAIFPIKKST